jgi:hypothetical protein
VDFGGSVAEEEAAGPMTPRNQRIVRELVRAEVKRIVDRRLGERQRMPLNVTHEATRIMREHSHCGLPAVGLRMRS